MGKSSAPPAPDYQAAAVAQGEANKEAAQYNTGANRVNQVTAQGSSTWSMRPGADPNNPQPGDFIQTTTLSPEQQAIYNQTAGIDNALLGTASRQLGRVDQTFNTPIDLSGLPAWRTSGQNGAQPSAMATSPGGMQMQPQAQAAAPQAQTAMSLHQAIGQAGQGMAPASQGMAGNSNMQAVLQAMLARGQ